MKITCKYCGIVNKPHHCPHSKKRVDRTRTDSKTYVSKEYRRVRQEVLDDYNYICLYSLYVKGTICKADITHHIVEVLEDECLANDYNNLIPLEYYNHVEVHELYKKDRLSMQSILRNMLKDFKEGDITLGKYKNEIERLKKVSPHYYRF